MDKPNRTVSTVRAREWEGRDWAWTWQSARGTGGRAEGYAGRRLAPAHEGKGRSRKGGCVHEMGGGETTDEQRDDRRVEEGKRSMSMSGGTVSSLSRWGWWACVVPDRQTSGNGTLGRVGRARGEGVRRGRRGGSTVLKGEESVRRRWWSARRGRPARGWRAAS